jgi:hypothetical protein
MRLSPISVPETQGIPRLPKPLSRRAEPHSGDGSMFDVIMLAIGLGFFALSIAYGQACEQL